MFVHLSIHRVRSGKESDLITSMRRFGAAIRNAPGCRQAHALRDPKTGRLFGLAIWDSKEQMLAARPLMDEATKDDPFEAWEDAPPDVFHLDEA